MVLQYPLETTQIPTLVRCVVCDVEIGNVKARLERHLLSQRHLTRMQFIKMLQPNAVDVQVGLTNNAIDTNSEMDNAIDINSEMNNAIDTNNENPADAFRANNVENGFNFRPPVEHVAFTDDNGDYFPFETKKLFFASLLLTQTKQQLSDGFLKYLWWWLDQLGVEMPAISRVKAAQANVLNKIRPAPSREVSIRGNVFYRNTLETIIKNEVANPMVMAHLTTIPEDTGTAISEVYQASKWRLEPAFRSPMINVRGRHFYVDEFARIDANDGAIIKMKGFQLRDGQLEVVCNWLRPHRGAWYIDVDTDNYLSARRLFRIQDFFANQGPLQQLALRLGGTESEGRLRHLGLEDRVRLCQPNPLRARAKGKRTIMIPTILFIDDMSGNRTKRWNHHESCYISLAGLPFAERMKTYHIHFLSSSNHASGMEMLGPIVDEFSGALTQGMDAFDAVREEEIFVVAALLCFQGDNPMQSLTASHIGTNGKKPCRRCDVELSVNDVPSLLRLASGGTQRNWHQTREKVVSYISRAGFYGRWGQIVQEQTNTGIKDWCSGSLLERFREFAKNRPSVEQVNAFAQRQGLIIKHCNPLFRLPYFDGHMDTPIEILHTILLGPVKYVIHRLIVSIRDRPNQRPILSARMRSFSATAMVRPLQPHGMIAHIGTMVGKDFKALCQASPFLFHGLVGDNDLVLLIRLAEMTKLAYRRHIADVEVYQEQIRIAAQRLILAAAAADISMLAKPKFHFLIHLAEDSVRYGPPLMQATEKFEAFNGVVRQANSQTNRHAPSRDLARKFADWMAFRHILSGGWWKAGEKWVQASTNVQRLMKDSYLSKYFGVSAPVRFSVGRVRNKVRDTTLQQTAMYAYMQDDAITRIGASTEKVTIYQRISTVSGMMLRDNEFALIADGRYGRLREVVQSQHRTVALFEIWRLETNRIVLGCPSLLATGSYMIVDANQISGPVNAQHDCETFACTVSDISARQEREDTNTTTVKAIEHQEGETYLLNIFCIFTHWIDNQNNTNGNIDADFDIERACANVLDGQPQDVLEQFYRNVELDEDSGDDMTQYLSDEDENEAGPFDNSDDESEDEWDDYYS